MKKPPRNTRQSNRSSKRRVTSDALAILENLIRNDPATRRAADDATVNALAAHMILDARQKAGLTQQQLALLAGTRQPVIARLENAEYRGHSLTMLQRIAAALNRRLEIRLSPASRPLRTA